MRQRWWTGVGIGLLLASIGLGTVLVRRALLRERGARALRDDFIANVSHELKTPLTSVRMYAAMLADPALDAGSRERHGAIAEAEAARLCALVDDLLDFVALERGRRRLEPEPVDLAAAARSLAAVWHVRAAGAGMRIECRADREQPGLVDATALLRILTNLLQNACRHGRPSRDGSPSRIVVEVGPGPVVEVRDNGPGVPAADRERIFGRFERARRGGEGAGLGLALSRGLAEGCGGCLVCIDSGAETVFRLTLPAVPPDEEAR
jgi:signal transduction histidine kinase